LILIGSYCCTHVFFDRFLLKRALNENNELFCKRALNDFERQNCAAGCRNRVHFRACLISLRARLVLFFIEGAFENAFQKMRFQAGATIGSVQSLNLDFFSPRVWPLVRAFFGCCRKVPWLLQEGSLAAPGRVLGCCRKGPWLLQEGSLAAAGRVLGCCRKGPWLLQEGSLAAAGRVLGCCRKGPWLLKKLRDDRIGRPKRGRRGQISYRNRTTDRTI
jgi:hypothetical protein